MKACIQLLWTAIWLGLAASTPAARDQQATVNTRPNFSGEWVLDLGRSRLDKPFQAITSGVVTIEHREPAFSFSRTFIEKGSNSTVSYTLNTDGREVAGTDNGMPIRQTLTWSGQTLVFLTVYQAPLGEARNTVRYSLLDGGKTLRAEESFRGPRVSYDNIWMFTNSSRSASPCT
jgi:hypothetical protein